MRSPLLCSLPSWSRVALTSICSLILASCGSVVIPEEHYYRLALPELPVGTSVDTPVGMPGGSVEVLRVEGFELASTLRGDRLLVAESPVQLRAYEFHRWISSLDRLVRDVVTAVLTRSNAFREVKGPTDGPGETLLLSGRILDFHQVADRGAWAGKVRFHLRLATGFDTGEPRVLFQQEFTATVPMQGPSPAAAVVALSAATGRVIAGFLGRCRDVGVFSGVAKPGK